jgi:predicted kinase
MIIVVFGLPGTGKTRFSRQLANELNAVHLNTDIVRDELGKKGDYSEKSKQQVYDRMLEKSLKGLDSGHNIILDGTFHKKERREKIKNIARKTGNDIFFIEMKASKQTVAGRLKKKRIHSEADLKVYRKVKDESDRMDEDHLVLQSDSEPEEGMIIRAKNYIHGYQTNTCPVK